MRPSRPTSLLQRLALAGAGLTVVALLFAVVGGLVAFGLWPDALSHDGTRRMVLRAPASVPAAAERPRLRGVAVARPVAVSRPPPRVVAARPAIAPPEDGFTVVPRPRPPIAPVTVPPTEPQPVVAVTAAVPLQPVTDAVAQTTITLAQTLGTVATNLERGTVAVVDLLDGPARR